MQFEPARESAGARSSACGSARTSGAGIGRRSRQSRTSVDDLISFDFDDTSAADTAIAPAGQGWNSNDFDLQSWNMRTSGLGRALLRQSLSVGGTLDLEGS